MAAETQSHIQYWKSFDIIALQRDLDAAANDLAARQDESENSRKKLIEQSREFKKATSEDIRKAVAPLLKGFQAEVDALSRRSKAAEAAFLGVYKKLIDVPNPVPVLEQALIHHRSAQKLSDYEIENQKLRETLAEYNSEFAEVKNQELTIKQLRDKIKEYELKIEAEVQSRILSQEKELSRQFQEREKQLHETQLSYAKKLGLAEQQMNVLKAALEASQSELFELKAKLEESATAKSDEMDLLMADLERANERASIAEKHSENLRDQVDKLQSSIKAEERSLDNLKKSQLEMELASKEREVTQLVEEVQKLQSGMAKLHHEYSVRLSRLEDDLGNKDLLLNKLNDRLAKQVDYDEISKELKILKSIEFSSIRGDGTDEEKSKPLETLLLEKNKTLQTENTKLKNANNDLAGRYEDVVQQLNELVKSSREQKALIDQLEDDLRKVNAVSAMFRGDAEGEPSQSTAFVAEAVRDTVTEVDYHKTTAVDSLIPIMHGQRERYRLRAQELELEVLALQQKNQVQQTEMDKIRSDNVRLYEKIKFLQNYSGGKAGKDSNTSDETEARYSAQYEQKLDPFTHFNKAERKRRYENLKLHEKITLGVGRLVMGNSTARTFAFIYVLFLHLLVFLCLSKLAITDSDNQCHQSFAKHMLAFHQDEHNHKL